MDLLDLAGPGLALPGCDVIEVLLGRSDEALTRFADSRIHQNVARTDGDARVRVVVDGNRIGVASTNVLTPEAVLQTAQRAREIATAAPSDTTYAGPAPAGQTYPTGVTDDEATARCLPEHRADLVAAMLAELPSGVVGAGYVQTQRRSRAFASSAGAAASSNGTYAIADLLASDDASTGHAEGAHATLAAVDPVSIGARAARAVELGRNPVDVDPGAWAVVLEPGAGAVMVEFLAAMAFSGKDFLDGQSAFTDRLGESVCSPAVTILDHPQSPQLPGTTFDAEGTPSVPMTFVDSGTAAAVAHDRATAARAGVTSTGHALPPPNPWGPQPWHLVLQGGEQTIAELVAGCERGLYVSRFHYTNIVHPKQTTITGMTRNGTYLIEGGRLVGAVRDMRFTESVLTALSTVDGVGSDVEVVSDAFSGSTAAPAIRLGAFTFTSGTA